MEHSVGKQCYSVYSSCKKRIKCQLFKLVKISLRIFYLSFIHVFEGIFVILYSDYGTLNPNCRCETSSIMASDKAVYAVPSMAESQNDKSVQGGHWVGRQSIHNKGVYSTLRLRLSVIQQIHNCCLELSNGRCPGCDFHAVCGVPLLNVACMFCVNIRVAM